MSSKIVLISDDSDFFEYLKTKLELRKSDELFLYDFDAIPEKIHLLESSVLIVNSENSQEKTLDLLKIFINTPIIVMAYNEDDNFKKKCFRLGAFDFMPLLISDSEFRARMIPAMSISGLLEKNKQYRDLLVKKQVLAQHNDVYLDYNYILDKKLEEIQGGYKKAVFGAIAPNEKTKYLLHSDVIESTILNNIRKNDILMNYAPNKYFLLMFDINMDSAQKLWTKISEQFQEKVYIGLCTISNQKREQLINEALNKLHEAINFDKSIVNKNSNPVNSLSMIQGSASPYSNFKMFKQEFGRKIEQVVTPVFYHIQQKYENQLSGTTLGQGTGEGYGSFYIKGKYSNSSLRITSPGFSKINIDITFQKDADVIDAKRITLEPEELEAGLLEDLLEQFILEYKRSNNCDN
ncbi:hypothetical protein IJ384_04405 [bacterium]|nr:hypothetical protein [bacterium]